MGLNCHVNSLLLRKQGGGREGSYRKLKLVHKKPTEIQVIKKSLRLNLKYLTYFTALLSSDS